MLQPTDHEWRNRLPPTTGSNAAASGATYDRFGSLPVEGSSPTAGEEPTCCPVCEFAGAEYDDVYAHLMTAHRKSTISAALLRA